MTDTTAYMPPGQLAAQAAGRIAGHVRRLRASWPGLLAGQRHLAGQRPDGGSGSWPAWCWLPMADTASALNDSGQPWYPADLAYAAAVGQWRLTGRHIVIPSPDVAAAAVPGPAGGDPAQMDLRLPREQLIEDLAGQCYYIAMPLPAGPAPDGTGYGVAGVYAHLEYDGRPGQGPELRLLVDHEEGLHPVPVLLTQPTLAWSAAKVTGEGPGTEAYLAAGELSRVMAWWVWPLIGAILDHETVLTKTTVLDGPGTPVDARGSQVWEITYGRPETPLRLADRKGP